MLRVYLTGMAMGAADVVPGVSGGTIAFISGIYARLINAIRTAAGPALLTLKNEGIAAAWEKIDGTFLLVLVAGIGTSVLLLAGAVTYLLATYPVAVWAFFLGLIVASGVHLGRQVEWRPVTVLMFVIGLVIAIAISYLRPNELVATPLSIFAAGSIAICAMILPGVSGSFLLLMMGMYTQVLAALKGLDLGFIAIFAGGCLTGLLLFSHLLGFLLQRYYMQTLALLTGFLFGSLRMVWPWQQAVSTHTKSDGSVVTLKSEALLPTQYAELTGQDAYLTAACFLFLAGVAIVWMLSRIDTSESESIA